MKLYCGIDLHSTNHLVSIINEGDKPIYRQRLKNELNQTLEALAPYQQELMGIAVESTFNWYWLVDGLMDAGYPVHLVNTSAVKQYDGLKHTDDKYDAFWLAHLMRLGILPTGYIYPKAQRALRDLLRKRSQLVRHRTMNVLSVQNQYWRHRGMKVKSEHIKKLDIGFLDTIDDPNTLLAINSNLSLIKALNQQIETIESTLKQ